MSFSDSIFLLLLVLFCVGYALYANRKFDRYLGEQIDVPEDSCKGPWS